MRRDLTSPDLSGLQVVISPHSLDQTPTLTPSPVTEDRMDSLVVTETSDDVPQYIKTAAESVARALSAEAEDDI